MRVACAERGGPRAGAAGVAEDADQPSTVQHRQQPQPLLDHQSPSLVDRVVPAADLMATVTALAGRIAANGPLAVTEVKRLVHQGQSMALDHALALEQKSFGLLFATEDQREGMSAFLAKPRRAAQFKGR